jgi:hypothetical protein
MNTSAAPCLSPSLTRKRNEEFISAERANAASGGIAALALIVLEVGSKSKSGSISVLRSMFSPPSAVRSLPRPFPCAIWLFTQAYKSASSGSAAFWAARSAANACTRSAASMASVLTVIVSNF